MRWVAGVLFMGLLALGACVPAPKTPGPVPATTLPPTAGPNATPTPTATPLPSLALTSVADIVDRVRPAVVSIVTEGAAPSLFLQPIPSRGAGTGIIFHPDGYILTNNHVVEDAGTITVSLPESPRFPEGGTFEAKVVGRDPLSDVAVVKIEARDLPTVPFGDSTRLRLGDWVIAIGNAQDLPGGPTVTQGIVSAVGRSIFLPDKEVTLYDLIQTDAAINPGNSGGPLVNLAGEVVGMNTAIIAGASNIGFAIASATVVPIRDELVAKGKVAWPWMGVTIQTLTPTLASQLNIAARKGVLIQSVNRGDPAARAGLRRNDVIIRFGGTETPTLEKLQPVLRRFRSGDRVEVIFVRGADTLSVTLALAEMPPR